jgi:hypothetical protein
LANLLATGQVGTGDMLCIDWDRRAGHLVFWKEGRMSELTTSICRGESPACLTLAHKHLGARLSDLVLE